MFIATHRPVQIYLPGWQLWDGDLFPIIEGGVITSSLEFKVPTTVRRVLNDAEISMRLIDGIQYAATAQVVQTREVLILDLGGINVLSWRRPGSELPEEFVVGAVIGCNLVLAFNAWSGAPWEAESHAKYEAIYEWRVDSIVRYDTGGQNPTVLGEASIDNVDSVAQDCILTCTRVVT